MFPRKVPGTFLAMLAELAEEPKGRQSLRLF